MSNHQTQSNDEVVVPGFKKIVKQLFLFIFWIWGFLLLVVKKNAILIIAGLVVGLILGYFFYISKPIHYRVSMIVQNNELSRRTYAEMVRQLNNQIGAPGNPNLAAALNSSKLVASRIIYLDSKTMSDEPLISDTSTRLRQPFKILAYLTDNIGVDTLEYYLMGYLNNGPYLKKMREAQTKIYNDRLTFIDAELRKLDSLKAEYNRFLASSKISATFYNNAFNPADIYQQSNSLFNQRELTLRWLNIDRDPVALIDGFKTPSAPHSMGLAKTMIIFGGIGIFLAFILGFFKQARKRLV
jgi:hypothetical protein